MNKIMKQCVEHRIIYHRKWIKFSYIDYENYFYFPREIASRTPHSFATDVWSLGILIVTLLTGHPPFDTDSILILIYRDLF